MMTPGTHLRFWSERTPLEFVCVVVCRSENVFVFVFFIVGGGTEIFHCTFKFYERLSQYEKC